MTRITEIETAFGADVVRYDFGQIAEPRGSLCPVDFDELPFKPSSMFFISGVPSGTTRGGHARRSHEQLLLCVAGAIRVGVRHRGRMEDFLLNDAQGVYLKPNVWSEQTYCSADARLLVLASGKYDPADYAMMPS